jgi:hypothetical protein
MRRQRTWFSSPFHHDTELYIETTTKPAADGMPRDEHRKLAAVTRRGYGWMAEVWLQDVNSEIILPSAPSKEVAMEAVMVYVQNHSALSH